MALVVVRSGCGKSLHDDVSEVCDGHFVLAPIWLSRPLGVEEQFGAHRISLGTLQESP